LIVVSAVPGDGSECFTEQLEGIIPWQGGNAMKVGRLITDEGIEFSIDNSQLREFIERLRLQVAGQSIADELSILVDASGFIDPEDYERAAQAAYYARQTKKIPAAA
jgi:hypothetical protein